MLDSQRRRHGIIHEDVAFTRILLYAHLGLGLLITLLLLLHELFLASALVLGWYLASIAIIIGILGKRHWCRWLLAAVFLGFAIAGAAFLPQVSPASAMEVETPPMLTLKVLPLWLALSSLGYATGGIVLLVSARVRSAAEAGFDLW